MSNWYYTFVNKDGKITIYEQYRFDDFEMYPAKNNTFYQHIVDTLSKAKTKEEFADALDNIQETYKDNTTYKLNFASYKPYFGVDGVNEAIATSFIRSNRPQSIQNG